MSEHTATVADRPSAPSVDSATSIVPPQQAMKLLEARRAWTYAAGLAVICLGAIGLVIWLGGDPFAEWLHIGGLAATAIPAATFALIWRAPTRYQPWGMFVIAGFAMIAN